MKNEPLTHFVYVSLSASDRRILEDIAQERGATLSGVIRKLLRDAAQVGRNATKDDNSERRRSNDAP